MQATHLNPLQDLRLLLGGKEVRHLAGVQDHTDVLKEGLVLDLEIGEQEDNVLAVRAGHLEDALEVGSPRVEAVSLVDLDLKQLVVRNEGCQFCQRLPAATPDPDKKGVATFLLDDSVNS